MIEQLSPTPGRALERMAALPPPLASPGVEALAALQMPSPAWSGPRLTPVMVMHSHGLGGIERHVLVLMQALARRGHRPHFAGPRDSWIGEQLARQGLPQVHVPMRGMYDLASGWRLQRYLRQVGADLVHGHAMRGTRYAVWGGARAGVTAVGSAHSTVNGRWLRGAEALFPVSMAVSRSLTTQGYRHHLSAPVYPGIPDPGAPSAERRAQQRRQLGIAADEQILGMIARFVDKKGHDVAVAALHRLRDLPVRLLLIGDHRTAVGDALRSQIQALDLQSRVLLVGQRDDAAALCSVFDVFLQPSRREPLGLTLLEAAAQERPIVASEVDGIPEVVLDGQTGLLVPPNDPERLAAATQRLLADPALAARLGRMARQHYLSRFTEDAMIERLLAGYRGVLRETRA